MPRSDPELGERLRALLLRAPARDAAAAADVGAARDALREAGAVPVSTTRPVPARTLGAIYQRRAAAPWPRARREVRGYDDLLPALAREAELEAEVRVHRFRVRDVSYIVFTDAAVETIVAVLTSKLS